MVIVQQVCLWFLHSRFPSQRLGFHLDARPRLLLGLSVCWYTIKVCRPTTQHRSNITACRVGILLVLGTVGVLYTSSANFRWCMWLCGCRLLRRVFVLKQCIRLYMSANANILKLQQRGLLQNVFPEGRLVTFLYARPKQTDDFRWHWLFILRYTNARIDWLIDWHCVLSVR